MSRDDDFSKKVQGAWCVYWDTDEEVYFVERADEENPNEPPFEGAIWIKGPYPRKDLASLNVETWNAEKKQPHELTDPPKLA